MQHEDSDFVAEQTIRTYYSNEKGSRQERLANYEEGPRPPAVVDFFSSIDSLLGAAKRTLPPQTFYSGVDKMCKKYKQDMASGIAYMSLSTAITLPQRTEVVVADMGSTEMESSENAPGGKSVRFQADESTN